MTFKETKELYIYLKDPLSLQNGQSEPLFGFPINLMKQEILSTYHDVAAVLFEGLKKYYPNATLEIGLIQHHLLHLACIYISSRIGRIIDFHFGLTTRKVVSIEDYIKIRTGKLLTENFASKKTKDTIRKSRSASRSTVTKSQGRRRGVSLHRILSEICDDKHTRRINHLIPIDTNRVDLYYEARLFDLRVIIDMLRKCNLQNEESLIPASCFLLNKFILEARLPLPTRDPKDFVNEAKMFSFNDFMSTKSSVKFGKNFWQHSLYKRMKKDLVIHHQSGLGGPIGFSPEETVEQTLASILTLNTILLFNVARTLRG